MINRRVLAIILAITMATSASVSSGFDVFASEVPAAQEELTETEENILETVGEILDKRDEAEEIGETPVGEVTEENAEYVSSDGEAASEVIVGGEITGGENDEVVVGNITDAETNVVIASVNETLDENTKDMILSDTAEDGTVVVLEANKGAFSRDNLKLSVRVVTGDDAQEASEKIDKVNPLENAAKRVTYDIKVLNSDGVEEQPIDDNKVRISFKLPDAPSGADDVTVYHHDEKEPDPVFIASAELSEDSETAVVGATAESESGTEGAETNVVICNTDSDNTSAVTSSDASDDENYEDYELIDDVTVSGETTSFSYYTVDFTYDQKEVSIEGDTNHNELSKVLAKIGITEDIVSATAYMDEACTQPAENNTVTLDGKDLFKVYAEGGVWYVDAINAFNTTHGLLVKTADAEYKVTVKDAKIIVTVKAVQGALTYFNGQLVEDTYDLYGGMWSCFHFATDHVDVEYYDANWNRITAKVTFAAMSGYELYWPYDEYVNGVYILYERVNYTGKVNATVKSADEVMGTIQGAGTDGKIQPKLDGVITKKGSTLQIEGMDSDIVAVAKNTAYIFDHWTFKDSQGNQLDQDTKVVDGMQIIANFKITDQAITVTAVVNNAAAGAADDAGYIKPRNSAVVPKNTTITGNKEGDVKHSNIITIGSESFEAVAKEGYAFAEWEDMPDSAQIGDKDTNLTAKFVGISNPRTITFVEPYFGKIEKSFSSESVQVPDGAKLKVTDNKLELATGSIYVTATPNSGYEFIGWLDGNGNFLTGTSSVTSDMRIRPTFRFTESQYVVITANEGGNLIYRDEARDTVTIAVEGMTGTYIRKNPSNSAQLLISYINAQNETVTESVNSVAKTGYKLAAEPWSNIPDTVSFTKWEVKADFVPDNVLVKFYVDAESGKGLIEGIDSTKSFSTTSGKVITKYGSRLKIEGYDNLIIASSSDANWVFDSWNISPNADRIEGNNEGETVITAKFRYVKNGSVTITPIFDEENYGVVYPKTATRVEKGLILTEGDTQNVLKIGNETFTAVANEGKYFDHWILTGASLSEAVTGDASFEAFFINPTGSVYTINIATASGGSYRKSFEGNYLKTPENARYSVRNENEIIFGDGKANIIAIPEEGYKFVGWYAVGDYCDPATREHSKTYSKLEGENKNTYDGMILEAKFDYIKYPDPYVDPEPTPDPPSPSPQPGGTGGGTAIETDSLDTTNYHAENTYGSWENPIDDGEWEHLTNDTWKYNSSTPMKSCWACIVNPYANVDKGQHTHDWFFFNPYGAMLTGWRMIDGKWYYFEPISNGCRGGLYMSTTTPDGYQVDANGALIQ